MDIECNVNNQVLSIGSSNTLANFSENYLILSFTFKTEDWNNLSKFALFFTPDRITRVAMVEDEVIVPADLLQDDKLVFSVYGVNDDQDGVRITTNKVILFLNDSGFTNSPYDEGAEKLDLDTLETIYLAINGKSDKTHTHKVNAITDLSTIEMEVTFSDNSTETYDVVIKDESQ